MKTERKRTMTIDEIIDDVIEREGKTYTNDPADPGGPTKYGVTWHDLSEYLGRPCTAEDVQNLDEQTAHTILKNKYVAPWQFIWYMPLRILMIDTSVLHGIAGAKKILQRALGVEDDGDIGPLTMNAFKQANQWLLSQRVLGERILSEVGIAIATVPPEIKNTTSLKFLKGWVNRALQFL